MQIITFIVLLSALFVQPSFAQEAEQDQNKNIPVYDFEAFKAFLEKDNDTLYVINFWASWCKPCIEELPYFEIVNKEYSSKKVKVLLVSLDFEEKIEKQLKPLIQKKNLQSEVIVLDDPDANSWIAQVDKSWGGAIPATYIYRGKNKGFYEDPFTLEELKTTINKHLNNKE